MSQDNSEAIENTGLLAAIARDFNALIPRLVEQKTSLWADLNNRPATHFRNVAGSAAVNFGIGNTLYAGFIGSVAGLEIGPGGAVGIQAAVTLATAARQIIATYNGESLAAPFRIQALANFATALVFSTNAVTDAVHGQWRESAMMVLPVGTFASWGAGHWSIANFLDRLAELRAQGADDDTIAADPLIKKHEKFFSALYGAADITAPWKNMPIDEVAQTLARLISDPVNLTKAQLGSLISLPFFIGGLAKTFAKGATGDVIQAAEKAALSAIPSPAKKAAGLEKGVTPSHYYAGGYGVGAVFAALAGQPLFAAAQAFWGKAYSHLAVGNTETAQSADAFTLENSHQALSAIGETNIDLISDINNIWNKLTEINHDTLPAIINELTGIYEQSTDHDFKDGVFAILEVAAPHSSELRGTILQWATDGDPRAIQKSRRLVARMLGSEPDIEANKRPKAMSVYIGTARNAIEIGLAA